MVAQNLQGGKDTCGNHAQHILTPIAQHHTGYGWRDKAEGQEFPDMTGLNDNEVIAAESP